jgi:uncharacterized membrane protein YbhN (UPF0104 family)
VRKLGAAIGVALFAVIAWQLWRALQDGQLVLGRADWTMLLAAMAFLLVAYAAQAWAWHLLLRAAGGASRPRADCARWAVSLLGKYVPGKVFHAVGRLALYRKPSRLPAAPAYAVETLLTLTAAACVAAVTLPLHAERLPALAWTAACAGALVGLAASASNALDRLTGRLLARLFGPGRAPSIARASRALPLCAMALSYLLLGVGLHVLIRAWGMHLTVPLAVAIGALSFAGIAGIVAVFVPAGLGVREGALVWLLAPYAGLPQAMFIALAARVWLTAGDAVAAAAGALLLRQSRGDA